MKKFCLYRHYNKDGELLYIGKSTGFSHRTSQHKTISSWFDQIHNITIEHFENANALGCAERKAIEEENPPYNKRNPNQKKKIVKKEKLYCGSVNIIKVKEEIAKRGWNFSQLAKEMKVSRQRLSFILHHSFAKLRILYKLAETIRIPVKDLLED